jgi:gliding motility-associated-like protein
MRLKFFAFALISILYLTACETNDDTVDHARVFIPTVFSPDNNKINDVFRPTGANISQITGFKMIITDEDGHVLCTTEDKNKGWDGLKSNGEHYPNGFYFYDIWFRFSDKTEEHVVGTVEIACDGW